MKPAVLFLCTHNAGRSQMAAAFMRRIGDGRVEVFSGGTQPAEELNPTVVQAMAEKGIDISTETPRRWDESSFSMAHVVVSMGCGDACPVVQGKHYVEWDLRDPAGLPLAEVRLIRDEVEILVEELCELLLPAIGSQRPERDSLPRLDKGSEGFPTPAAEGDRR